MTASNHPEKPFFDKIVKIEEDIAALRDDRTAIYESAKENEAIDVKVLRKAVRRHMEDPKKRAGREAAERAADNLLHRLGHLASTPLGEAARRAAG